MQWFNEPPRWVAEESKLTVTTGPKTDFWRKTHYGFIRDSGHFRYQVVEGNFTASVKITGQYRDLYDHAGLMLRIDDSYWIKCGIELVNGVQQASAVVTRDFSDWSVVPLPDNPPSLWLRVKREAETVEISYSLDGAAYHLLRLAYLPPSQNIHVGPMCCSPDGEGFEVVFEQFAVEMNE
jgi:regulation of enolase protein 1 (concanavalin A-like superfamily)